MAGSVVQLKRSSVAGKQPNTSNLSVGELAINLTDRKLYSSDGSSVFLIGEQLTNTTISGNLEFVASTGRIVANNSTGGVDSPQALFSDNGNLYWDTISANGSVYTIDANTGLQLDESGNISLADGALTQEQILERAADDAVMLSLALG